MKTRIKSLFFFTLFFAQFQLNGQTTDVLTGLEHPIGLAFKGNDLFISDQGTDKIIKIDVTQSNPVAIDVVTALLNPKGLAIHGDFLYFVEVTGNKISRIDLTSVNPIVEIVLSGLSQPQDIAFFGDELYFTTFNKISKIDITQNNAVVDVLTGVPAVQALAFKNEFLYFVSPINQQLFKIDVSDSTAVPVLILYSDIIEGLTFVGDELYMSNGLTMELSKINVTDVNPMPVLVAQNIQSPRGIASLNNEVYITHFFIDEKISKLNLLTLNTDEIFMFKLQAHPNPTSNIISISNISVNTSFQILDLSGKEVSKGRISANKQIDVKNLPNGLYYIRTENGDVVKFVKSIDN